MKRSTFPLLVILMLGALAVTSTSAAIVPAPGPSASGTGLFRYPNPQTVRTELWSFSFDAIANKNGRARGRAQFDNLTAQTQVIVRINCLSVTFALDTFFASMSGTVLHSNDPNLPKQQNVIFAASDGPSPPFRSDTITPLFPLVPFEELDDCHDIQPLTMLPVEDGGIAIQL